MPEIVQTSNVAGIALQTMTATVGNESGQSLPPLPATSPVDPTCVTATIVSTIESTVPVDALVYESIASSGDPPVRTADRDHEPFWWPQAASTTSKCQRPTPLLPNQYHMMLSPCLPPPYHRPPQQSPKRHIVIMPPCLPPPLAATDKPHYEIALNLLFM